MSSRRSRTTIEGSGSGSSRVAGITVAMLAAIVLTSMITSPRMGTGGYRGGDGAALPPLRSRTETRYTEIIGRSPRDDLIFSGPQGIGDYGECEVRPATAPSHPVTPTFTASYPGSGAKMTWNLIEAMTGLVTGDDFQLNGHENMVSIKTHYPSHEGREVPGAENIPRAILWSATPSTLSRAITTTSTRWRTIWRTTPPARPSRRGSSGAIRALIGSFRFGRSTWSTGLTPMHPLTV